MARFSRIVHRISKTERGRHMIEWMKANEIKPAFMQNMDGFVVYQQTPNPAQDDKDAPPTKHLLLNEDVMDDILIVHIFEQVRLAWQDHNEASKPEGINMLSQNLVNRFFEADRRSFVVAMAWEHAYETGSIGPFRALTSNQNFNSAQDFVSVYSDKDNVTFEDIRRFGFDSFFLHERPVIDEVEAQNAQAYVDRHNKRIDQSNALQIKEHFKKASAFAARTAKPSAQYNEPIILSYDPGQGRSVTIEELRSIGVSDFGPSSSSYLSDDDYFTPISDELYLRTGPEVVRILETLSPVRFANAGLFETPSQIDPRVARQEHDENVAAQKATEDAIRQAAQDAAANQNTVEAVPKDEAPKAVPAKKAAKKRPRFFRRK